MMKHGNKHKHVIRAFWDEEIALLHDPLCGHRELPPSPMKPSVRPELPEVEIGKVVIAKTTTKNMPVKPVKVEKSLEDPVPPVPPPDTPPPKVVPTKVVPQQSTEPAVENDDSVEKDNSGKFKAEMPDNPDSTLDFFWGA